MFDFVLVLCGHGDTKDQTAESIARCYENLPEKFTTAFIKDDALIGRSRSVACTRFLKDHMADYMIFVDTDMQFTPTELEKIYLAMLSGHDVVGGSYSVGSGTYMAVASFDGRMLIDGNIHPVKYLSTGFMGISRKALLTIRDTCPFWTVDYEKGEVVKQTGLPILHEGYYSENWPFFESGAYPQEKIYISEDWDFCNKVRRCGMTVYVHSGVMVDHVKEHTIVAEDVLKKIKIDLPRLDIQNTLIGDLAEYLEKPLAEVRDTVINWKLRDKTVDDIGWFYELAQFNCYEFYWKERLQPLAIVSGARVLDYGCGIGSASLYLSEKNQVVGYDINPKAIEFSTYRAKKHGFANVEFTNTEPDISKFDIITFIDVLEHFEDLQSFLKRLGNSVISGTKIYHFDAFYDHLTPGHHDHSKQFSGWAKDAGFLEFDTRWMIKR